MTRTNTLAEEISHRHEVDFDLMRRAGVRRPADVGEVAAEAAGLHYTSVVPD